MDPATWHEEDPSVSTTSHRIALLGLAAYTLTLSNNFLFFYFQFSVESRHFPPQSFFLLRELSSKSVGVCKI